MRRGTDGLDRLKRKLALLPQSLKDAVRAELDRSANEMADTVRRNLPLGPERGGHLRDAVHVTDGRHDLSVKVSMGDAEHPYAAPFEFGHANGSKHTPGNPTFFPARKVVGKKHRSRVARAARKAIKAHCEKDD